MRLHASKEHWHKESADDTWDNPWLLQLRAPSSTDPSALLSKFNFFVSAMENEVEEHAQPLLILAWSHQLGSKPDGNINGVQTTLALVGVAKSPSFTCPWYCQPLLRADLARICGSG